MAELRSTTFQLEFKGQDGITGIRQFTRAVTDADKTVEELSQALGDNVEVTAKNIKSKKELTSDARRLAAQMERNNAKIKEMTRLYDHQSKAVNKTANEQEVLNAVYRLGANATEAQKKQVEAMVLEYQKVREATDKTQTGFRNLRGVSQNLGWQLQDVAVQAQMGTSAFVILGQQGSQMASAFGPTGALVGAFIAVTSSIIGVAAASDKAKEAAKNLKDAEFDLLETLREKASNLQFLEAAQLRYLKAQDEAQLKKYNKELDQTTAAIFSQGNNWTLNAEKQKENAEELERLRALQETLEQQIHATETRINSYNNNLDAKTKKELEARNALLENIKSYEQQAEQLGLTNRAIALNNAFNAKATQEEFNRINAAFSLIEAYEAQEKALKELNKAQAKNAEEKAFLAEFKSLVKQTETVEQQYARRKSIIDDYVAHIGKSTEKTRIAYENLDDWRNTQLDKEFLAVAKNLSRQTVTTEQEYDKRKKVIDEHVSRVGSVDSQAAQAYADLELWKTDKLTQEYNKREAVRKQIEKAQFAQFRRGDAGGAENELFAANLVKLGEQKKLLGEQELEERIRIDELIEAEVERHTAKLADISQASLLSEMGVYQTFLGQLGGLFQQVSSLAEDGSKEAEALFYLNQAIALANAVVSTEMAAAKALELGPILGIPAASVVRGLGYASAGVIAGQTIAGAFDNGGNIPGGQLGIVSEFGDELVNGQLIKGPARVTSREDTAKLMNGGGETKIIIENRVSGATFREQRIDENTVKIIAEQVFSDNIDSGVSSVIGNRNSKSTKSLKSNYKIGSKY